MVHIEKIGQEFYLNFFNSKEIYSVKRFDTMRKATNYANRWGYIIYTELPETVKYFTYNEIGRAHV